MNGGDQQAGRWGAHLRTLFPRAEGWLTDDGRTAEGALRARKLLEEHMPELVPLLDRLAEQVDRPAAGTFLTMAALRPFFSGCTQVATATAVPAATAAQDAVAPAELTSSSPAASRICGRSVNR